MTMDIPPTATPESSAVARLRERLSDLMAVEEVKMLPGPTTAFAFVGRLYGAAEETFDRLSARFAGLGYTAMLSQTDDGRFQVVALQGIARPRPTRRWVNLLLFALTVVSAMFAGLSPEFDIANPRWYLSGLPFAAALLGILLAHELAHYFVARRYGSPVSPPYFVPMPLSPLGTMGAVIFQQAPMRDRKALFDIGIAGPLAGLIVALPLLIIGLRFTYVGHPSQFMDDEALQERLEATCREPRGWEAIPCLLFGGTPAEGQEGAQQVMQEGNSILYWAAKYIVFGRSLPGDNGEDVWLSSPSPGGPVVFAAWAGLLVTALNLLPIGQLDGGHVAYALLGRRAWKLAYVMLGLLGTLGLALALTGNPAWITWIIWAGLGLLLGPRHPPPLNDTTRLGTGRVVLGVFLALIFILTFVPVPLVFVTAP